MWPGQRCLARRPVRDRWLADRSCLLGRCGGRRWAFLARGAPERSSSRGRRGGRCRGGGRRGGGRRGGGRDSSLLLLLLLLLLERRCCPLRRRGGARAGSGRLVAEGAACAARPTGASRAAAGRSSACAAPVGAPCKRRGLAGCTSSQRRGSVSTKLHRLGGKRCRVGGDERGERQVWHQHGRLQRLARQRVCVVPAKPALDGGTLEHLPRGRVAGRAIGGWAGALRPSPRACPSIVLTGSRISERVMGHTNSAGGGTPGAAAQSAVETRRSEAETASSSASSWERLARDAFVPPSPSTSPSPSSTSMTSSTAPSPPAQPPTGSGPASPRGHKGPPL